MAETVEILFEKLMGSDNPLEQIQAAYALSNHPSKKMALNSLIKGLVIPDADVKLTILDILLQPDFFGEEIVLPISNLLKDEDSEVKKHAAEILGTTKDKRIVASLINTLNDENSEVRHTVMAALANIGDISALSALESIINYVGK
ncbi:MAG: HEAT repeat domain-containing protein [Promethearchaeota archaeon]